jgi:hypothetical protein
MDVLAVKQACKFAKDHAVADEPIVSIVTFCCLEYAHHVKKNVVMLWALVAGLGCTVVASCVIVLSYNYQQ